MKEPDQPNDPDLPPMRAQDYSEVEDWPGYFEAVLGKGARETLVAALDSFAPEGFDRRARGRHRRRRRAGHARAARAGLAGRGDGRPPGRVHAPVAARAGGVEAAADDRRGGLRRDARPAATS